MSNNTARMPWAHSCGDVPLNLNYSGRSLSGEVFATAEKYPDYIAYEFMGATTSYKDAAKAIQRCARALVRLGIKEGDKVIYSKYSGTEVKFGEEEYIIVSQNDIIAVIE